MRLKSGWIVSVGAALLLAGCGGTDQDKRDRGLETGSDVAAPESEKFLGMTEAERRAAEEEEEQKQQDKVWDETQ